MATMKGVERMNKNTKDALVSLFGDEDEANRFAEQVDQTNRSVEDEALIARDDDNKPLDNKADDTPADDDTKPEADNGDDGVTEPAEFELTDDALGALADRMAEKLTETGALYDKGEVITAATEAMTESVSAMTSLQTAVETLTGRVAELEKTDEDKQRQWLEDQPRGKRTVVSYRPREANKDNSGEKHNFADVAAATLEKKPARP